MRKIFYVAFVAALMNFSMTPNAFAEVVSLESSLVKNSDVTFCSYASFAQRKEILRAKINQKELMLERNPNDAKLRHELAEAWHELGRLYYAGEEYTEALNAFNKAVELEPNNAEFKRDRDAALAKVKSGAKKEPVPKFNGLG